MEDAPLPVLSPAQARALGCLIEKEATTPDAYPLTVNAAQVAANQKTAREPVMNLDPGQVHHALRQLESMGLARQVFSSRAERYEHTATARLSLPKAQLAVLALLLLRGPQTLAELHARADRLARFADVDDVRHHLERLIQRTPALVVQVPRGPGQREDRYMHLLSGPVDIASIAAISARSAPAGGGTELEARVAALEAEVAQLRDAVSALLRPGGTDAP